MPHPPMTRPDFVDCSNTAVSSFPLGVIWWQGNQPALRTKSGGVAEKASCPGGGRANSFWAQQFPAQRQPDVSYRVGQSTSIHQPVRCCANRRYCTVSSLAAPFASALICQDGSRGRYPCTVPSHAPLVVLDIFTPDYCSVKTDTILLNLYGPCLGSALIAMACADQNLLAVGAKTRLVAHAEYKDCTTSSLRLIGNH